MSQTEFRSFKLAMEMPSVASKITKLRLLLIDLENGDAETSNHLVTEMRKAMKKLIKHDVVDPEDGAALSRLLLRLNSIDPLKVKQKKAAAAAEAEAAAAAAANPPPGQDIWDTLPLDGHEINRLIFEISGLRGTDGKAKSSEQWIARALDYREENEANMRKLYLVCAHADIAAPRELTQAVKQWLVSHMIDPVEVLASRRKPERFPYDPGFVSAVDAMDRVTKAGLFDETKPGLVPANKQWGQLYAIEVLGAALGDKKLSESAANQLYKSLCFYQRDVQKDLPAAGKTIAMCLCKIQVTQGWVLEDPQNIGVLAAF